MGSVVGIISLSVTCFQGCVKGFEILSAAQHIGHDADRLRSMLQWEQVRLLQWAERVGLSSDKGDRNHQLNWTLIAQVLKRLEFLLTDSHTLQTRYNLHSEELNESSVQPAESINRRKGVAKLWSYVKPDIRSARAQIIQNSASLGKRLRWATLDQEKLKSLLCQIGKFPVADARQ